MNVIHIPGDLNPADILTKFLSHHKAYMLVKEFIFWSEVMTLYAQNEGSVKTHEALPPVDKVSGGDRQ